MTPSNTRAVDLLHGKVAVVTGGARGIGLSVARRFSAAGAAVVLGDIDAGAAENAAHDLRASGARALAVRLDVTNEDSVKACAAAAEAEFGGVDCAVANAGVLSLAHVVDTSLADWRRVLEVNLTGAFLTCKVFARHMIERGTGGRIILTSSLFGVRGGVENAAYSASKFGMVGLMQCAAAELAPHRINVNAVCPGQVDTEMLQGLFQARAALRGETLQDVREALVSRIPLRRLAETDEIADVYVFLASDLSRYVVGQSLVVDGGWQVA